MKCKSPPKEHRYNLQHTVPPQQAAKASDEGGLLIIYFQAYGDVVSTEFFLFARFAPHVDQGKSLCRPPWDGTNSAIFERRYVRSCGDHARRVMAPNARGSGRARRTHAVQGLQSRFIVAARGLSRPQLA